MTWISRSLPQGVGTIVGYIGFARRQPHVLAIGHADDRVTATGLLYFYTFKKQAPDDLFGGWYLTAVAVEDPSAR